MESTTRWNNYTTEFYRFFLLWLSGITFLGAFRVLMFIVYNERAGANVNWVEYATALQAGFKFDSHIVSIFLLLPFLANIFLQPFRLVAIVGWMRALSGHLFFLTSSILCVISFSYFAEYNSLFNYFLFEGLYDDQIAIVKTIWGQYHPIASIICIIVLTYSGMKLTRRIGRQAHAPKFLSHSTGFVKNSIVFIVLFVIFIAAARGSIESRPAMRKWASVTSDPFLNSLVINPIRSLAYAARDFNKLASLSEFNPYKDAKDIEKALRNAFPDAPGNKTITSFLEKHAQGASMDSPQHIFLVVMESYDSWPMQDKFQDLHLNDGVKSLAKKGVHFKNFLPVANSTMSSLASIISGIPYTGVNMGIIGATGGPEKSSLFEQFKSLGYQTNFFFGDLLSWQNIGNFVKNQGVDNAYSASNAGGKGSAGAWGVDDDQLFNLVSNTIEANQPSFNVIMTTTYHGPFNIDSISRGYQFASNSDYPAALQKDDALPANVLGHLWFSDKAVTDFVNQVSADHPRSVFALTGDHYSRRYFSGPPNLYEYSSVPLVMYGMGIDNSLFDEQSIGGHLDIAPTLIELIAPAGFIYTSFGQAMQLKQPDSHIFGHNKIMDPDKVWVFYPGVRLESWDGQEHHTTQWPEVSKNNETLLNQYNDHKAIAWQLLVKGDTIPQPGQ